MVIDAYEPVHVVSNAHRERNRISGRRARSNGRLASVLSKPVASSSGSTAVREIDQRNGHGTVPVDRLHRVASTASNVVRSISCRRDI